MSFLDNGVYQVDTSYKDGSDDFIFVLKNGKKIKVNAPHFQALNLIDCTQVTIDNNRKKTPVLIHTPYNYISACNYTVMD